MSSAYSEEPPQEAFADPSCSMNNIDEDDDWVIVKKQRITILIPPSSPDAANPQADMPKINYIQSSLISSKMDGDAAQKKRPEQLAFKKSQYSPPEDSTSEKAQVKLSATIVHKGVPKMTGEMSLHSTVAPVAKTERTKDTDQAVQAQISLHQLPGMATSPLGIMDKPRMPVISSNVANKIMRARLFERRVAGFGGLKNWLFDRGLGWFIDILDSEKLGMYQLVTLTMNQLKEMGLVAVGPRRKLIHAIDSLSRPHQFEMVS